AGGIQGDGQEPLPFRVGFDVEGQYPWLHIHVRRPQSWIVEQPLDAGAGARGPLDFTSALDAALDQVTRSKANVGLERVDVRRVQAIPERRHVGRNGNVDT